MRWKIALGIGASLIGLTACLGAFPAAAQSGAPSGTDPAPQTDAPQIPSATGRDETGSRGTGLDEIVVTARKQNETIQSIPETVRAIGATELANAHITRVDDLGTLVSNLNITTRADQSPDVVLRGVGSFGIVNGVGFYADDVQLFDGQTVRQTDLDRIEVLKGPQGTLYGGNNIGGAIKYVSKLPTDDLQGQGSIEYGSYATRTTSAAISGPIIADTVNARLSVFETATHGYQYDPILDRKLDRGNEQGGRLTLQAKGESTTATLYLNADHLHTGASSLYYRPASDQDYSLELLDGTRPDYKRTLYSATLNVEHRFDSDLVLTSVSSIFHSTEHTVSDIDKGPLPFLTGYQTFKRTVWSQELRLSNSGGGNFKWILGAFAQGNDPDTEQRNVQFIGDPPTDEALADPTQYAQQITYDRERRREYAAFANGQYKFGKFELEAGLRADYSRSKLSDNLYGLALQTHGTEILPKLSISYHPDQHIMAYATIARGYQAGGVVEGFDVNNAPVLNTFRPETTWSYEVGVKTTLSSRARLNVAAFYLDYRDRLFQTYQFQGAQFVQVTENIGASKNYGLEADLSLRLLDHLTLTGSGGFTNAEWKNVPFYDPDLAVFTNLKGRTAPFTPAYQGSIALDWTHELGADFTLGLRVDATAIGRQYWDVTDHFKQRPYQLVNLGARLSWHRMTLSANVFNVANVRYNTTFISAAEVGAPFNVAGIGRPRLWNVALSFKF